MTTNKKFLMLLMAGATVAPAVETANAAPKGARVMIPAPTADTAPVTGNPPRLRRTDSEQAGLEMPCAAIVRDAAGKPTNKGYYFGMASELNGVRAQHRVQLAMVPFTLMQDTDGSVFAQSDMTKAQYITDNDGNEYRNSHNPTCGFLPGSNIVTITYGFQPNNDTIVYMQTFNGDTGERLMPQTQVMANNNDDFSMNQDGIRNVYAKNTDGSWVMAGYYGANGNNDDAGWVGVHSISADGRTLTKQFGVIVAQREERSRGRVILSKDRKTVFTTWTEGNTQPQRDGVWLAAVRLDGNDRGRDVQQSILWKQQIAGRQDKGGIRTYAMRAKMEPIVDATGLETDQAFVSFGRLRGNNNTNGKGGTYYEGAVGVVELTRTGMSYVVEPSDLSAPKGALDGVEHTHLGLVGGNFGTVGATQPSLAFLSGSHFGGGDASQIRIVSFNPGTKTFTNAGTRAAAPHDRHLYSNYLGNNPGNQGRDHSHMQILQSPFATGPQQILVIATAAKDTGGAGGSPTSQAMNPEIKLAGWLTVLPVQEAASNPTPDPVDPPNPNPNPTPEDPSNPGAGESLGGCSTGGSTGFATLLLIGLAAFIRRRK